VPQIARHPQRLHTLDYIGDIFTDSMNCMATGRCR
jgi:acetyl-CoA carboxylase alpha subunit